MEGLYSCIYRFKNVPKFLQEFIKSYFMDDYNLMVEIFNEHISDINKEFDLIGIDEASGPYLEDINPEYVSFISERIQPFFDSAKGLNDIVKFKLDEYGCLVGYIPFIPNSKIWLEFKEL